MIRVEVIILLGFIVCAVEFYKVFVMRKWKNFGLLFSFTYFTLAYIHVYIVNPEIAAFQPYIRIGWFLILMDKTLVFAYEMIFEKNTRGRNGIR